MSKEKILAWIKIHRPPFQSALFFPFFLGMVLAWFEGYSLNYTVLVLSTIGIFFLTNNCFLANEYFDYETDKINVTRNPFSGGTRVLPNSQLPRKIIHRLAILYGLAALIIGIVLQFHFKTGLLTLPLGIIGLLSGYFFTAKPIQLAYHALGELAIAVVIGCFTILGGYYLHTHKLAWLPVLVSLPWVMAVTLLKITPDMSDYESDKLSGKRGLVVRMGKEKAVILHNFLIIAMWLGFVPLFFLPVRKKFLFLLLIPFSFSLWNFIAMRRGAWRTWLGLKNLSLRAVIYAPLTPLIICLIFILSKLVS